LIRQGDRAQANYRRSETLPDDPEMADRDVESFDEVSRSGHNRGFSGKYKDLAV
jgi:hypothetical protein